MDTQEIPFARLVKNYCGENQVFCEVTELEQALAEINSETSCGGVKIDNTGWVLLASPSPHRPWDERKIFVCRESLLAAKID